MQTRRRLPYCILYPTGNRSIGTQLLLRFSPELISALASQYRRFSCVHPMHE
jgi:hypothetical protein